MQVSAWLDGSTTRGVPVWQEKIKTSQIFSITYKYLLKLFPPFDSTKQFHIICSLCSEYSSHGRRDRYNCIKKTVRCLRGRPISIRQTHLFICLNIAGIQLFHSAKVNFESFLRTSRWLCSARQSMPVLQLWWFRWYLGINRPIRRLLTVEKSLTACFFLILCGSWSITFPWIFAANFYHLFIHVNVRWAKWNFTTSPNEVLMRTPEHQFIIRTLKLRYYFLFYDAIKCTGHTAWCGYVYRLGFQGNAQSLNKRSTQYSRETRASWSVGSLLCLLYEFVWY